MKEFTDCPNCGGPVEKEIKKEGTCFSCKDEKCGWGICL